jgi:hypothetical protein
VAALVERQQEEGLGQGRLVAREHGSSGRAAVFSLGLVVGFLLLGYAALRVLEVTPRGSSGRALTREAESSGARAWSGQAELGGATVRLWLLPLHDEPVLERFRTQALRARHGLPPGEAWRLLVAVTGTAEPGFELAPPRVQSDGAALATLAELATRPAPDDPLFVLLAAPLRALRPGESGALALWGELGDEARPEVELVLPGASAVAVLARDDALASPRSFARLEPPGGRSSGEESLAEEVARLRQELDRERVRHAERELAFQAFQQQLTDLEGLRDRLLGKPEVDEALAQLTPEEEAARAADQASRTRAADIGRALAVRMKLEGLRGLDLLESGALLPGPPAAIGPVVFRVLDERGRLTGSLNAARLRLEASVAARTLTLVLEDGFESQGGERVPFQDGARRITLVDVDPEGWFDDFPELFEGPESGRVDDDGCWRLADVRRELNRLFALDTSAGWYRLHSLGGVRDVRLNQVLLEELEPSGRVRRRYLADTLELALEDASLVLTMKNGAIVRGDEKQPFKDGVYRLVLPGVAPEAWRAAALPGLSAPPASGKAQEERAGGR